MTINELLEELKKFDGNLKVTICDMQDNGDLYFFEHLGTHYSISPFNTISLVPFCNPIICKKKDLG